MWKLLGEGAKFSLIAQSMVFLVLFLLVLVILAMKFIFYRPGKAAGAGTGTGQPQKPAEDEPPGPAEEVLEVAAIAAALEMHQEAQRAELRSGAAQEGPWAPRPQQGRAVSSLGRARRWSHG